MARTDERGVFKRLVLSANDFEDAGNYVHRLRRCAGYENAPELDATAREALQVALVVSYARPFSGNRKAPDVDRGLPAAFINSLTPAQRALHEKLLSLRDQEFAHTDPRPADVRVRVSQRSDGTVIATPVNSVSATKVKISDAELNELDELIEAHFEKVFAERTRIEASLTPGATF